MPSFRQLSLLILLISSNVVAESLDDLDFMTGRWEQKSSNSVLEEWWMASQGNTKVAAFRWAQDNKIIAIELVIISKEDDGIFLRFKHYSADYKPWEKDEPNVYRLQSVGNDKAIFTNTVLREGIPNVIIYQKMEDSLQFRGTNDVNADPSETDLIISFHRAEGR